MISFLGYTFSAAASWLLLGIPVGLTALVYIYRARGVVAEAVVSTLLFLRQLPEQPTARKRFSPPLQFWIDLAVLSLLSLAAAGILAVNAGKRIAVVVDSSLSMSAQGPSGATRFADATRLAAADVASLLGPARFTVYSAAGTLSLASEPDLSAAAAATAISKIVSTLEPDRIDSALKLMLSNGSFDAVWLYTDMPLREAGTAPNLRVTTIHSDPALAKNSWIRAVEASSSTLLVQVASCGNGAHVVSLSAQCFSEDSLPVGSPLSSSMTAPAGAPTAVRLSPLAADWRYCKIVLRPEGTGSDTLSADNEAWVTRPAQNAAIQILSPLDLRDLGLQNISGYSFLRLPSADDPLFSSSTPTIVHRMQPPAQISAPLLAVVPPPGKLPWGGEVGVVPSTDLTVTRWDASHALLQYVNPTLISVPAALPLSCDAGAQEILSSSTGALACAGARAGQRYIVSALELFPFDGAASPTVSILTLNAMKWLFGAEAGASSSSLTPGRAALAAGATDVRYIAPIAAPVAISQDAPAMLPSLGIVAFTPAGSRQAQLRAVNIFSDDESDLSRQRSIEVPQDVKSAAQPDRRAPLPFSHWLAALALAVLVADILRRIRARSAWVMR